MSEPRGRLRDIFRESGLGPDIVDRFLPAEEEPTTRYSLVQYLISVATSLVDDGQVELASGLLSRADLLISDEPELRAPWWLQQSRVLAQKHQYPQAITAAHEARALGRTWLDWQTEALGLLQLANVHTACGRYELANKTLSDAWDLFADRARDPQSRSQQARCELSRAAVFATIGQLADASEWAERAKLSFQSLEDPVGVGQALNQLGLVSSVEGDHRRATEMFRLAATSFPADTPDAIEAGMHVGVEALYDGNLDLARQRLGWARAAFDRLQRPRDAAGALLNLGHVALTERLDAEAEQHYLQASEEFRLCRAPEWQARADIALANLARRSDREIRPALSLVIPAVIYLSARRFQYPRARQRSQWTAVFADATELAFELAERDGDSNLIAHLIEMSRNHGIHTAESIPFIDPSHSDGENLPSWELEPSASGPSYSDPVLGLSPPPALRMPDGSIMLDELQQSASTRYGPIQLAPGELSVV